MSGRTWSTSAHNNEVKQLCAAFSRRLRSNFVYDLRQAGCDKEMAEKWAIQAMLLVHGLWNERRVSEAIAICVVLGVFRGMIDDARGQWRQNMRQSWQRQPGS